MGKELKDILNRLPAKEVVGEPNKTIKQVVSLAKKMFDEGDIMWISDANLDFVKQVQSGTIICTERAKPSFRSDCTYLIVDNPRFYFLSVVKEFFLETQTPSISKQCIIDPTVRLGKNVSINAGVVIEKDCEIGDETTIDCNTIIKRQTIIGNRVKIGANNTIGGVGFGYERDENGQFVLIPHLGNVVIQDDVEIGNNTTIDRGVLGSTFIKRNVKIDNLVHIAHGVEIGENSLIIANAMIAGSVTIGENVWVAPSSSVLNKLRISNDAVVGMGAVVLRNVAAAQTVVGNPAKDISIIKKS